MEAPRVTGACAGCGFVFDLFFGLDCPRCRNNGLAWASYVAAPEDDFSIPHVLTEDGTAHRADCDACGIEAEVHWLDTLYKLQDNRV